MSSSAIQGAGAAPPHYLPAPPPTTYDGPFHLPHGRALSGQQIDRVAADLDGAQTADLLTLVNNRLDPEIEHARELERQRSGDLDAAGDNVALAHDDAADVRLWQARRENLEAIRDWVSAQIEARGMTLAPDSAHLLGLEATLNFRADQCMVAEAFAGVAHNRHQLGQGAPHNIAAIQAQHQSNLARTGLALRETEMRALGRAAEAARTRGAAAWQPGSATSASTPERCKAALRAWTVADLATEIAACHTPRSEDDPYGLDALAPDTVIQPYRALPETVARSAWRDGFLDRMPAVEALHAASSGGPMTRPAEESARQAVNAFTQSLMQAYGQYQRALDDEPDRRQEATREADATLAGAAALHEAAVQAVSTARADAGYSATLDGMAEQLGHLSAVHQSHPEQAPQDPESPVVRFAQIIGDYMPLQGYGPEADPATLDARIGASVDRVLGPAAREYLFV